MWLIIGVIFVWVGTAFAADFTVEALKGTYAFTGQQTCLNSFWGFKRDLTPIGDNFFTASSSHQGILTFDGNGRRTAHDTQVRITPPATAGSPPSASSTEISSEFTYTVTLDGRITTKLIAGSFKATELTGPRTGQTFIIDKRSLSGMISEDYMSLALATKTPEVVRLTFSNWDVTFQICHVSEILIRVGD